MSTLSFFESKPLNHCQTCNHPDLSSLIFLGYVPPVNHMMSLNTTPDVEMRFPLELLRCNACGLVQLGYEVDPHILFPYTYPYLSGTTKILTDNFKDLAEEVSNLGFLSKTDQMLDIGANDGSLLAPFRDRGYKVLGIEPSKASEVGRARGIDIIQDYFTPTSAEKIHKSYGLMKVITATNVFAHIKDVHSIVDSIQSLLTDDGIFISESHYLIDLINTLQYDTIYHEHLRYYSLNSLQFLLAQHGFEIFRVKRIPTHGGSIRVYAARKGKYPIDASVTQLLKQEESSGLTNGSIFQTFRERVIQSKLLLLKLLEDLKKTGKRIYGVGAPSRASTLINYTGLDDGLIDCIVEVSSSHKRDKYIPGTRIPVVDEARLFEDQPDYALLFSWHISDALVQNLRKKGYENQFIIPLPTPTIVS